MTSVSIGRTLLVAASLSLASATQPGPAGLELDALQASERHAAGMVPPQVSIAPTARSDDAAVKDLVSRYNAARDRQDAASLAGLLAEHADQLVSSGEWRRGRAALVRGMLESSRSSPGERTITVEAVRFLGPDVALADARYEIAGSGGAEPRRMWSTFVMARTSEGWRIEAIRNMLPAR